ncbi:MAG: DUF6527 family protein [Minisyncoccia bacterium]
MKKLTHKFVTNIPEDIQDGTLYISIEYATVIHKCACGCGIEVVTPLSPTDWRLTFDGETASLYPSIGNWSVPCQSHYWITNNEIAWAPRWTNKQIEQGRKQDEQTKEVHYKKNKRRPLFGFFLKK